MGNLIKTLMWKSLPEALTKMTRSILGSATKTPPQKLLNVLNAVAASSTLDQAVTLPPYAVQSAAGKYVSTMDSHLRPND